MHFKFTSYNGLLNHCKEIHSIWLTNVNLSLPSIKSEKLEKNTWPQWDGTWARDTVMAHWSADTLYWQLSIDHNMDVYYQVKHRLQAPTLDRTLTFHIGLPLVRTEGRTGVRSRDYQNFSDG